MNRFGSERIWKRKDLEVNRFGSERIWKPKDYKSVQSAHARKHVCDNDGTCLPAAAAAAAAAAI